ncbi:D-Ala-D-Ala carboxypeptidase family metallohydrolase [Spirulina sp. CS-785/01]|uniref:D-Ala-D-Ala carboxypeptidase family metallohydrolase n=1 Tax=Spirulina sp. CS-785/01 TaxID=3021716 RepID=UPI00232CA1D5|nr:D-Ala-D-Ala carboxypeptidase family metallohydrolase [Spirulina sp. CS-785/01]MDB9313495.1 D-Ala-D-Ala carboxypeptidase family metallohydrolase [Spirulina sp. CS-785/01]
MSTLLVTQTTIFKTKPIPSSKLANNDKLTVYRGEYGIKNATKTGNHYKVSLDHALGGRTDWYVFQGHMEVLNAATLVITDDTVFKTKPVQSGSLSDQEKAMVTQRELGVKSADPRGNHLLVTLMNPIEGRTEWYVFKGHVDTMNIEDYAPPQETPQSTPPQGRIVRISGIGQVGILDSIVSGGNFTWSEATKGGSRLPVNAGVTNQIMTMAKRMDEVRSKLGDRPITITSWYRPPRVNRAVGGARNSSHLRGHGVDFVVSGMSPREVQRELDPWWNGGLGYGRTFTHLDNRGYRARWNYGS